MPTYDSPQKELIDIKIGKEWIAQVISFLITQDIPFHLNYSTLSASVMPEDAKKAMGIDNERKVVLPSLNKNPEPIFTKKTSKTPLEKRILAIAEKYIFNGITCPPPTQEQITEELNISLPSFKAHFKALYGKPFYQLYMEKRMEGAAQLLKQGYKCNEVSQMVGYGEKSAIKFNKMFQKHLGITPKKYQIAHYESINKR